MTPELHPLLESYYTELDPAKRKAVLDEYEQVLHDAGDGKEDTSADVYRKDLFAARHIDKKHPGQPVDRFLLHLMTMLTIYKSPGFFPKSHRREVLSCLKKMQLDERPFQDPACEDVLYRELRNAVRRYYSTCSSPAYGRTLLGMMSASDEQKAVQCCADIWSFSYGIAGMVKAEEEMALLCRAANDEYCALMPGVESLDAAYRKLKTK
ncbi:MAG: hypothetical protein Q4F43_05020 [Eubacteriales bacterium]|nr:hypothetical protein [Eubacteriales bacterium]